MFTKINESDIETKGHCTNSPDSHSSSSNIPENIPFTSKHSDDIQDIIKNISSLTNSEKLSLLEYAWKPHESFVFPKTGNRNISCQKSWLDSNEWLIYSSQADALYCINCILFPSFDGQRSKLCSKDGLKCCSSAKKKIDAHGKSPSHGLASNKSYAFQLTRKDPSKAVNVRWNKTEADRIKKNRSRLITIIECVIFLAKQGLSFRGHREDEEYLLNPNNNPGNFKALLQLLRTLGNEDITYLLDHAPRNAIYTSKTIYEWIIDVLGEYVTEKLAEDVKSARFYSILADEAQDISNQEQMALVIRFVDKEKKIREEFIGFIRCDKGVSGEALSKLIFAELNRLGISMQNCRAQGYDGAGAMAGSKKGVAARISKLYPWIIFVHCSSHVLNLSVMRIITVQVVRDMFDNCRVISDFSIIPRKDSRNV